MNIYELKLKIKDKIELYERSLASGALEENWRQRESGRLESLEWVLQELKKPTVMPTVGPEISIKEHDAVMRVMINFLKNR